MMLIKPDLANAEIVTCLQSAYGLDVDKINFLPLGADFNTAVYRVNEAYFLKLRCSAFSEASVMVPKYLADLGFKQIIPPIATHTGRLWADLGLFKAILYPYVEGKNGMEAKLSDQQWIEFGTTMKRLHRTDFPKDITKGIERETFSSTWRAVVKTFLEKIEVEFFKDHIAAQMALFLKSKSNEIHNIVDRAEVLASLLKKQPLDYVLCHGDIHLWNVFVDQDEELYMVDWDTLIFAPKERDLMFIGAGIGDSGRASHEEEILFYQGYGQTEINYNALAYYRFERIIQDIGEYCTQIFLSDGTAENRQQSFEYLKANFLPNGTIEKAYQLDTFSKNMKIDAIKDSLDLI